MAVAVAGGTIAAAAPASPALLRKLRRLESAERRFDMTPPSNGNIAARKIGGFFRSIYCRPAGGPVKRIARMGDIQENKAPSSRPTPPPVCPTMRGSQSARLRPRLSASPT
jgi:hypothetical protein